MKNYKIEKCQRCGKEIPLTVNNRKYCKECANIMHKEQNKQWYKEHPSTEGYKLRFCKRCGKEFKPTSSNQKYCLGCRLIMSKKWHQENPDKWRITGARHASKRRQLDFVPLNEWFKDADAHHLDFNYIIYIPKEIHRSIYHSVLKDINMDIINAVAFNYLGALDDTK
jgi:hypothetical protein